VARARIRSFSDAVSKKRDYDSSKQQSVATHKKETPSVEHPKSRDGPIEKNHQKPITPPDKSLL